MIKFKYLLLPILLTGCSVGDYQKIAQIAQNPSSEALKQVAISKGVQYAHNPKALEQDLDHIRTNYLEVLLKFQKAVSGVWGKDEVKEPSPTDYVKYTNNYKSRAHIDFERGVIRIETIDQNDPMTSLQKAIVTTLLTPEDPRSIDLYDDSEVKLEGKPFLAGQVKDYDGVTVLYAWRANRFANALIDRDLQIKTVDGKRVHFVTITMENDALDTRAARYAPYVNQYATRYNIDRSLVYAIMEAESSFNPFAVSHIPAYGLMQIVPQTAGVDTMRFVKGKDEAPTKEYLFDPQNNIELGVAYLHILENRYLKDIRNSLSKEYAVISAYNTGAGNVLRTFDRNRATAFSKINALNPNQLYKKLVRDLPYAQTRRYLQKVTDGKKRFIIYSGS